MASLVENIIRKLLKEDFIRFLNGEAVDGDGNPINIGSVGVGSGLIPRYAYASDLNGTGFTLVSSTELEYVAVKVAAPDAVLTVGDFAGQWYHRKGLPGSSVPGSNGLNGRNGGFPVSFSGDTAATRPGNGLVKFNHANPALATEMYIDAFSPSGTDLTGLLSTIPSGAKFVLAVDSPTETTMAVFRFSAAPVNNTNWFTVSITNTAISTTSFADGDTCTFQIMGFSNVSIDPVTGRLMVDGVDKSGTTVVSTFSALPADPTTVPKNVYYVADIDTFVYARGSEWWPVNRRATIYRSGDPIKILAPAVLATAIADNGSGKVRLTGNGHQLTAASNNGKIYISGGGTWSAGLYRATYVSANNYDLPDVAYSGGLGVPTVARGNATDEIIVAAIPIPPMTAKSSLQFDIVDTYNDSTNTKKTAVEWGGVRFFNRNDNGTGNIGSFQGPIIINLNSKTLQQAALGVGLSGGKATSGTTSVPVGGLTATSGNLPITGGDGTASFNSGVATTAYVKTTTGNSGTPVGTESFVYTDIKVIWEV